MSTIVPLEEVQRRLPELIAALPPGQDLVIEQNGVAVATLTRSERTSWPCQPGSAKHLPHWMAPDFDAPLDDFREYME
jgi:antitoxin (DNA-binding transcriptional repressor) of toxin-antitoxin stability system